VLDRFFLRRRGAAASGEKHLADEERNIVTIISFIGTEVR
jgi:hypothetical protein